MTIYNQHHNNEMQTEDFGDKVLPGRKQLEW